MSFAILRAATASRISTAFTRFIRDALGKAIVLIAGRPLLLSPQTIGPFRRGWTRFAAIRLMRSARAVVSRDKLTTQLLNQLGLGSKVVEATDVAFRLPYETQALERKKSIRVGINISGLLFNGGYTRSNMFALAVDYPKLARDLVGHFAAQPECEVHLISHVISDVFEVEDDYQVAQRLAKETPGVIVAPRFRSPSEAKSYIATMDFFCGCTHACLHCRLLERRRRTPHRLQPQVCRRVRIAWVICTSPTARRSTGRAHHGKRDRGFCQLETVLGSLSKAL